MFFQWLSAIPFSGGCSAGAAVAEGLSAALMMFSSNYGSQTQQNADGKRHCILVGASKPYPFPTPVYSPAMQILGQSGNIEARASTSIRLADAETVAKAFPQCSISLSVICPTKLPKLRAIYKAGKRDLEAADPSVDTSKNPNFLVLISGNFKEACAAFSHREMESLAPNQSLVEMDMCSGSAVTSNPSVMNHQPISAGNIPAASVNIGKLAGQRRGKPELITRLQGFKSASASEMLAANWPPTIEIGLFVPKEIMYKIVRKHPGKADILVFWAVDRHSLLNQLQESNIGAAILLPSQIMFLFVSDKTCRLVGMLLSHENMEINPKILNQQLQAQLLHQLQPRLKEKQPLSLLQQQQQPLQQLPQQQPPNPLKRRHSFPLQQQSKVPRMHLEETPQTQQQQQIPQMQQIEQQQPITEMAVNQECMQGTGSSELVAEQMQQIKHQQPIIETAVS